MADEGACRLGPEPLSPVLSGKQIGDFHFFALVDRPGQEPASSDDAPRFLMESRPESQLGTIRMSVQEPLELFPRLLSSQSAFWEVASDLRVSIEGEQVVEIARQQASHDEPFGLEDRHRLARRIDCRVHCGAQQIRERLPPGRVPRTVGGGTGRRRDEQTRRADRRLLQPVPDSGRAQELPGGPLAVEAEDVRLVFLHHRMQERPCRNHDGGAARMLDRRPELHYRPDVDHFISIFIPRAP